MAISSGFFDAVSGDRTYSADVMSQPYASLVSDGVIPNKGNKMAVAADSGMVVKVRTGFAFLGGKWIENDADVSITLESTTLPRIASIVLKMDKTSSVRACSLYAKYGTAAASPTAPTLEDSTNIKEIALANVYIAAAATAITQSVITDKRGSTDCPWCGTLIQDIDVSDLYAQYNADAAEGAEELSDYFAEKKDEIDALLSTSAATSLQNQIDALDTRLDTAESDIDTAEGKIANLEGWTYSDTTSRTIAASTGVASISITAPSGYKHNSIVVGFAFKIGNFWYDNVTKTSLNMNDSYWDNSNPLLFHCVIHNTSTGSITITALKIIFRKLS